MIYELITWYNIYLLPEVNVPVVTDKECELAMNKGGRWSKGWICAGGEMKDSCQVIFVISYEATMWVANGQSMHTEIIYLSISICPG